MKIRHILEGIRHLRVVQDERVVGIVSIGDLRNACRVIAGDESPPLRRSVHGRA
jgi:CBS domain-containing protein